MILALGAGLLALGLITDLSFTAIGVLLVLLAVGGWIAQLLPGAGQEQTTLRPPSERARPIQPSHAGVAHLRPGMPGNRTQVPEKIHPYTAGIKGGAVGGVAMAVVALAYGVFSFHGLWYPVNLLVGTVLPLPTLPNGAPDIYQLERFHFGWLLLALVIHVVLSLGLGLLYGVLLPMLPGRPILLGGVVAPLLWTGAVYGFLGVLNPLLDREVNWFWFVASQIAYGVTVGWVVVRSEKIEVSPLGGDESGPEANRERP